MNWSCIGRNLFFGKKNSYGKETICCFLFQKAFGIEEHNRFSICWILSYICFDCNFFFYFLVLDFLFEKFDLLFFILKKIYLILNLIFFFDFFPFMKSNVKSCLLNFVFNPLLST